MTFGWIFGAQNIDVKDKEKWAKIDSDYKIDNGAWKDLKFGVRYEAHDRTSDDAIAQGPSATAEPVGLSDDVLQLSVEFQHLRRQYPDRHLVLDAGAAGCLQQSRQRQSRSAHARVLSVLVRGARKEHGGLSCRPISRATTGRRTSGVRYVHTKEDAISYTQVDPTTPGAVLTSAFGPFVGFERSHTYNDVLPSANLKLDVSPDLVARFAASETMTRADYSALAGFTNLSPPGVVGGIGGGSGGNPDLKPIRSTNLDAGLEWYFAKRSLLSATALLHGLAQLRGLWLGNQDPIPPTARMCPTGCAGTIQLDGARQCQGPGRRHGTRLPAGVHRQLRLRRQTTRTRMASRRRWCPPGGDDRLVGTSKNTYNVSGYFENKMFNARVCVHLPVGVLQRPGSQHGVYAGCHRHPVGIAGIHHERSFLDHVRWP